ncbi:MAG TPA: GtrA family protein [Polyangiaceae bacterium]|nr:GtrA family protein [Polyangiaceae bacterium]
MPTGPCLHDNPAASDAAASVSAVAVSTAIVLSPGMPVMRPARESLRARLHCFGRTMVVGFWANVLDFGLLALCLRVLHIEALSSRVIALLVSGLLTFVGSRSFAFRVTGGNVPQQAGRFIVAELAALPLNLLSFQLCSLCAPYAAPEVVSFFANALVFVAFSYPVRRLLVFGAATTQSSSYS